MKRRDMFRMAVALIVAIAVGTLIASLWPGQGSTKPAGTLAPSDSAGQREAALADEPNHPRAEDQAPRASSSTSALPQCTAHAESLAAPTAETRELVNSLVNLPTDNGV